MPIVFEEVTGEVLPERGRGEGRGEQEDATPEAEDMEARIRAVMAHERRRAERLCDR